MEQYKQIQLPAGIDEVVKVFDKEFINHPCQECSGSGKIKHGVLSIFNKVCTPCQGRGYHTYENTKMLFLGNNFMMLDLLQVAKGLYVQLAKKPSNADCGLCIKRPDQKRDEEYRIRRGHVVEDLLKLSKPLSTEKKNV